jgi:hypothetical protein
MVELEKKLKLKKYNQGVSYIVNLILFTKLIIN